jgi:hypothetical protein
VPNHIEGLDPHRALLAALARLAVPATLEYPGTVQLVVGRWVFVGDVLHGDDLLRARWCFQQQPRDYVRVVGMFTIDRVDEDGTPILDDVLAQVVFFKARIESPVPCLYCGAIHGIDAQGEYLKFGADCEPRIGAEPCCNPNDNALATSAAAWAYAQGERE